MTRDEAHNLLFELMCARDGLHGVYNEAKDDLYHKLCKQVEDAMVKEKNNDTRDEANKLLQDFLTARDASYNGVWAKSMEIKYWETRNMIVDVLMILMREKGNG